MAQSYRETPVGQLLSMFGLLATLCMIVGVLLELPRNGVPAAITLLVVFAAVPLGGRLGAELRLLDFADRLRPRYEGLIAKIERLDRRGRRPDDRWFQARD